ncbi:SagB/ThcOx family dehydrogenase [Metapseudomonas furukawaii]|uniref:SagB/ThcOx family dehydrogenase n=1 Tax=Metapseudomonas furukawaii TaxID=1149133 RepID=UPI00068621E4|nr:SagB/ThcOx family dehydrogenase [Pseudomonas furukawaii]
MSTIPHDYYLKFCEGKVLENIHEFHYQGNYLIHQALSDYSYLHNIQEKDLEKLTGNELSLYPGLDVSCGQYSRNEEELIEQLKRERSCANFIRKDLSFETIKRLCSPLLTVDENYYRGYPSGGALYPVETFIFSLGSPQDWPCDERVLHLLNRKKTFEPIQETSNTERLTEAILPHGSNIGTPSAAIIFVAYIPKTSFKYRYRGYRLALMEAGSMYMLLDLNSKALGLKNRVWSGYSDVMICKHLGLNPTLFFPMAVQFFGYQA